MTRDEAIAQLRAVAAGHGVPASGRSMEMWVDGYVALGILKLDAPKHIFERAADVIDKCRGLSGVATVRRLNDAGIFVTSN